ncbi:hypothetical protein DH2020_031002 [Rehmannia glutinosa]|uniref:Septum site-determining protein MinD n=1 Tax=Rehmannia glutinosa TaxID=99300 RepID=A0ABR0VMR0_REHGL
MLNFILGCNNGFTEKKENEQKGQMEEFTRGHPDSESLKENEQQNTTESRSSPEKRREWWSSPPEKAVSARPPPPPISASPSPVSASPPSPLTRRWPPQPRPSARPRESRQLHRRRGAQRRLPTRSSPSSGQTMLLCISKPRSKLPLGFGGKALIWLVEALKSREEGAPDFILIDCPAGIDAGFITAITPANEAVLVTTPDITSLRDADRVTGLLECDGIRDIKMIVNRVRTDMIKGEDMMSVLDVQEMLGLPLLGVIPEDSEVIRSTNRGYPLVLNKPPACVSRISIRAGRLEVGGAG